MFLHFPVSLANTMHALQKDIRPQINRKIHSLTLHTLMKLKDTEQKINQD